MGRFRYAGRRAFSFAIFMVMAEVVVVLFNGLVNRSVIPYRFGQHLHRRSFHRLVSYDYKQDHRRRLFHGSVPRGRK